MRPIVFLDCETTGLNKQHDRIIQLSALRFDRETMKPTARFDYIIRPSGEWEMSAGAEEVHGITKEMVENSGKYLTEVIEEFDNIIVKFGRFRPNQKPHFDEVLGVNLASDNQYAEKIS